ncbi:hypothetical protein SCLCIDRAFT_1223238 [Scleroderma citrinum Foug A]|uniref:BTB domain-containing protein n=1 Tax=Scleroderma citrinum Foug A TaxID=1036808 RepID=A0A0C3D9J1_9AGAM|nr:hypothetical protein SCLCIDRAFT_1223238 [Scleroderma citrinum Foug A]
MFLLPQGDCVTVEGLDDNKPVVLESIEKSDFEQLLKVLLHRKYGTRSGLPLNDEQWMAVLKLSTMWEFDGLRKAAIDTLGYSKINAVDKLVAANRYNIDEWLLPALLSLAQRPESFSIEEGHRIGLETALKLASVREKLKVEPEERTFSCPYSPKVHKYSSMRLAVGNRSPKAEKLDYTPMIRAVFGL